MKAIGIRRPLRSLPIAILSLALAQHLGEEIAAATELAAREAAAAALVIAPPWGPARESASGTGTILHEVGLVADLYLGRRESE